MNRVFPLIVIAIIVFGLITFTQLSKEENSIFVRGVYGSKCYPKGFENKNIKHPLYFDSLNECIASL